MRQGERIVAQGEQTLHADAAFAETTPLSSSANADERMPSRPTLPRLPVASNYFQQSHLPFAMITLILQSGRSLRACVAAALVILESLTQIDLRFLY